MTYDCTGPSGISWFAPVTVMSSSCINEPLYSVRTSFAKDASPNLVNSMVAALVATSRLHGFDPGKPIEESH
jgi:hypothetical protein